MASLNKVGSLLFVAAREGKVVGEAVVESPRGVAFDREGRLLVLSGARLLRYTIDPAAPAKLSQPTVLIAGGLEDPHGLTVDAKGDIEVSDWGRSQQVKIFSSDGKLMRTLGKAGAPKAGRVQLAGIAFGGDKGISKVEVSTDKGTTWQTATLKDPLGPYSWRLWR